MKKSLVLLLFISLVGMLAAQNPTPYNGTPPTFNTFDANYVRCKYKSGSSSWAGCNTSNQIWKYNTSGSNYTWYQTTYTATYNNATTGVLNSGTDFSHRLIVGQNANFPGTGVVNGRDKCMCYQVGNNYVQEYVMPYGGWDGNPNTTNDAIDTIIQIGGPVNQGKCSQSIEYWFKPDTNNSVLMVMFSFAQEKACHEVWYNPFFTIEVLDQNYNLLNLGYYSNLNGQPMSNPSNANYWPYSQFLIVPIPECSSYPSIPYCRATPSTYDYYGTNAQDLAFQIHSCPSGQYSGQIPSTAYHGSINCEWFQYTPIAFNLTEQARNNQTVIFRVKATACQASYHWAYGYFAAKMVPAYIQVDACTNELSLSVPYGFRPTSYQWYAGVDSASASYKGEYEGMRDLVLNSENGTRIYPYYRCEMLSMTGVPFVYEAYTKFYDLTPYFNYVQLKQNCDYKVSFSDSSTIMLRSPAAVAGGNEDTTYQTTQLIRWYNLIPNATGGYDTVLFAENNNTPQFTYASPGDHQVMISIWDNDHTCSADTVLTIHLDSLISGSGVDTIFTCEENLPIIYDQATFGELYTWHESGTRTVIYPGGTWNGCDSIVEVNLTVQKPKVEIAVGADYCDNFTTTLTAVSNVDVETYEWNTDANTPTIDVIEPGDYAVTITDEGGCVAGATVTIPACTPFVNLPNAITPSDYNGLNDVLTLPQKNLIQSIELTILNRNGEVVFYTTSKDFEWDGRVNGKLYVNTVYNYILKVVDYNDYATMFRGSITVL
ncbi:MAG: gliding motility-associated C-terminal domain-containing protein [Bacteroidales bacterium]|nr:gliding motility-associated C-terminal domain-containing protein [Bacteroidales bacterium]